MPIRAVIFDMGGVILRTSDSSGRTQWENRLGLQPGGLSDVIFGSEVSGRASIGKASEAEVWKHVGEHLKLGEDQLRQLERDFWRGDRADEELIRFIRGLRPHYKTAVLSNAWPDARKAFVEFGLADAFDLMIISAEEGLVKPDERIYRVALDKLGVKPEEAIFVDDMLPNVEGARAIGIHAIQFKSTAQTIADVKKLLEAGA